MLRFSASAALRGASRVAASAVLSAHRQLVHTPVRSGKAALQPPAWIEQLRQDAKTTEKSISYDIKVYDELSWRRKRFTFDKELWDPMRMSSILRNRLCLGNEGAEYTVIGEAFVFPDREDSPIVNEPQRVCALLWDHNSSTEKVMIQLSEHFPPLLWHTVKPTLGALRKVFSEFLDVDAEHMKKYLPYYEEVQNRIETQMDEKLTGTLSPSHMKDKFIEDMRKRDPRSVELDYPNEYNIFLGLTPHFRVTEDQLMKKNPFVFGWPMLLSDGNEYLEDTPLRMAAFRTVYSKSLLMFHTRLDLQVDHRQTHLPGDDVEDILLEMPVFCTVNYPTNTRLSGGRPLVQRFNQVMGTSYPLGIPVDVLATFARESTVKGERELLEELKFLTAASQKAPELERVFRVSEDQLSSNKIIGQLAYTIVYLALVNYQKFVEDVFKVYWNHPSDLIRVACAKGAHIVERQDLVEQLIQAEPEGRCKTMLMTTMHLHTETHPAKAACSERKTAERNLW
ncbi:hypothetical protein LPMP_200780 [Leishmania panamensis]|uniref:Uncharacterized protein n=1 Tax=Leishmania panamensis TaxID=5679 RepID=A0A088RP18_LEIPA|nr:hypothetical protein LPMP_200780 [Leishmania panamensis]AIN97570.1 hypothetical protein LPMP_200780 [Leishmania panamensis]